MSTKTTSRLAALQSDINAFRDYLTAERGMAKNTVLAYQRDLGSYDSVSVPALRPSLTDFRGPTLTFASSDEIGHVADLAKYDNSATEEGDNFLYAWRLSGCPSVTGTAGSS